MSEEAKAKISKYQTGLKRSDEARKNTLKGILNGNNKNKQGLNLVYV